VIYKSDMQAPVHPHPRDTIDVPAVIVPHQGTSYNPAANHHRELLLQAHETEEQRVREAEKNAALKEKMENARREAVEEHWAPGMAIDQGIPAQDHDESGGDAKELPAKKMPQRKTQAQRKKAARLLAEVYSYKIPPVS
jgi:nucleolar protein 53